MVVKRKVGKPRRLGARSPAELVAEADSLPVGVREQLKLMAAFDNENKRIRTFVGDLSCFRTVVVYLNDVDDVLKEACELIEDHARGVLDTAELYGEFGFIARALESAIELVPGGSRPSASRQAQPGPVEAKLMEDVAALCERLCDDIRSRGFVLYEAMKEGRV